MPEAIRIACRTQDAMPLDALIEFQGELKTLSKDAFKKLRKEILELGFISPVLIWKAPDGRPRILDGHQRTRALRQMRDKEGMGVPDLPVVWIEALDEKTAKKAVLALTSQFGKMQPEGLHAFMTEADLSLPEVEGSFRFADIDMGVFAEDYYGGKSDDKDPDAPAAPRGPAIAKPGDLWILGEHKLMCGDSTNAKDFETLMDDDQADLVFTDPPYGVSYKAPGAGKAIAGDELRDDGLATKLLIPAFKLMAAAARNTAAFYIWHAIATREDFAYAMKAAGLVERQYLIWAKPSITLGHADYQWSHEPCFYAAKSGSTPAFHGDRTQATVWRVAMRQPEGAGMDTSLVLANGIEVLDGARGRLFLAPAAPKGKKTRQIRLHAGEAVSIHAGTGASDLWEVSRDFRTEHPTQKPVELATRGIENSSRPGEVVLDPFGGSGSTLIAAHKTGRRARTMEKDTEYCDQIIARWEAFSGQKAKKA